MDFANTESFELTEWFEGVLKRYCTQLVLRKTPSRGSAMFVFENSEDEEKDGESNDEVPLKITSIKFEKVTSEDVDDVQEEEEKAIMVANDLPTRTNEVLRAEVKYYIHEQRNRRAESFLINVASTKVIEKSKQKFLTNYLDTEIREIEFYTQIVPKLEDWAFARGFNIDLGVPICFYGQYENSTVENIPEEDEAGLANKNEEEDPKSFLNKAYTTVKKWSKLALHLGEDDEVSKTTTEAMSILITNDLQRLNFKVNKSKLSIGEVKATLRELAQIHALSWAFQLDLDFEKDEEDSSLLKYWPSLLQPAEAIQLACDLVESGIQPVIALLKSKLQAKEAAKFERWLTDIKRNLGPIFKKLLTPPKAPLPATIIHLDLQYRNIAFKSKIRKSRPKPPLWPVIQRQDPTLMSSSSVTASEFLLQPSQSSTSAHKSISSPNTSGTSLRGSVSAMLSEPNPLMDCRLTNWKIVSYGSPMHDLSFLFLTSLTPEVRIAASSKLIQYYYNAFEETVGKFNLLLPFTVENLESEYDKHFFGALLFVLGNFEEPSEDNADNDYVDNNYQYFNNFLHALREVMAMTNGCE